MSKLIFTNQDPLPDLVDPIVNAETVKESIDSWIANCPDPDFVNILTAEIDD
jgi:hypothetical protein